MQSQIRLSKEDVLAAMDRQAGYDITATSNAGRFQAGVILELIRQYRDSHPDNPVLFIGHEEWFQALLERSGLAEDEAPIFARLARDHGQDLLVEYDINEVVSDTTRADRPVIAANVRSFWQQVPGRPSKYSFDDTLATPQLKVTNHSDIVYRLLDFGDIIVFDKMTGITGRPTTGILGALFNLIGEGRIVRVSMAISDDGLQITRARAQKGFLGVTSTVTVAPEGRVDKGIPENRSDLVVIEDRLKKEIELDYRDF